MVVGGLLVVVDDGEGRDGAELAAGAVEVLGPRVGRVGLSSAAGGEGADADDVSVRLFRVVLPAYDMGVACAGGWAINPIRMRKEGRGEHVHRAAEEEAAEEDDENHGEFLHGWLVGVARGIDQSVADGVR